MQIELVQIYLTPLCFQRCSKNNGRKESMQWILNSKQALHCFPDRSHREIEEPIGRELTVGITGALRCRNLLDVTRSLHLLTTDSYNSRVWAPLSILFARHASMYRARSYLYAFPAATGKHFLLIGAIEINHIYDTYICNTWMVTLNTKAIVESIEC